MKKGEFKMNLMPTIDKYIMTSIKVSELEHIRHVLNIAHIPFANWLVEL